MEDKINKILDTCWTMNSITKNRLIKELAELFEHEQLVCHYDKCHESYEKMRKDADKEISGLKSEIKDLKAKLEEADKDLQWYSNY